MSAMRPDYCGLVVFAGMFLLVSGGDHAIVAGSSPFCQKSIASQFVCSPRPNGGFPGAELNLGIYWP
jgi:hypothetical protein